MLVARQNKAIWLPTRTCSITLWPRWVCTYMTACSNLCHTPLERFIVIWPSWQIKFPFSTAKRSLNVKRDRLGEPSMWEHVWSSPEQVCLEVCCGLCKSSSYPQQQIQIEAFDSRTVVLCNSGLGGVHSTLDTPKHEKYSVRSSILIL